MSSRTHPASRRLRHRGEFLRILRQGRVHPGLQCLVRLLPNELGHARLGIAAPRRYGKAVRRNRFRRLVREAFRTGAAELGAFDYLVAPRKGLVEPTLEGVRADIEAARERAFAPRARPADDERPARRKR